MNLTATFFTAEEWNGYWAGKRSWDTPEMREVLNYHDQLGKAGFWPPTSTASFVGRSRTCPTEAMTLCPFPRYFVMVLALDGLSTITSLRPGPAGAGRRRSAGCR